MVVHTRQTVSKGARPERKVRSFFGLQREPEKTSQERRQEWITNLRAARKAARAAKPKEFITNVPFWVLVVDDDLFDGLSWGHVFLTPISVGPIIEHAAQSPGFPSVRTFLLPFPTSGTGGMRMVLPPCQAAMASLGLCCRLRVCPFSAGFLGKSGWPSIWCLLELRVLRSPRLWLGDRYAGSLLHRHRRLQRSWCRCSRSGLRRFWFPFGSKRSNGLWCHLSFGMPKWIWLNRCTWRGLPWLRLFVFEGKAENRVHFLGSSFFLARLIWESLVGAAVLGSID